MKEKMIPAFAKANGGLFGSTEKADIGDAYAKMAEEKIDLMGWADPFMPDPSVPDFIRETLAEEVMKESAAHYTAPVGSLRLRQLLAEKLKRQNGLDVDPMRNIIITPGSDSGLYFAILPFVHEGDEVLIPSPSYPNNFLDVEIMGGISVAVELKEEEGYQLNVSLLEEKVTERTRMVILTHPNNPTTVVYDRQSLEELADFCIRHDLILVCDQAFEDFTFEHEMVTPATLPGMFERTVTVFSFSKGMGLSGLRVGYIVADDKVMDTMYANAVAVVGAASTSAQNTVCKALEHPEFMKVFEEAYAYRRVKAYEILNSIPGVTCAMPQSGFLCWVNVSALGSSSEIVSYLVREAHVSVNDGINYGAGGEGHLRIVIGVYRDNDKVTDALYRIKDALCRLAEEKGIA